MIKKTTGETDWRTIANTVLSLGIAGQQFFEHELLAAHWNRIVLKILGFGGIAINIIWSQRGRLGSMVKGRPADKAAGTEKPEEPPTPAA